MYPQIIIIVIIAFQYNRIVKRTEDIWTGDFWREVLTVCQQLVLTWTGIIKKNNDLSIPLIFP